MVLLIAWTILAKAGVVNDLFLPSPTVLATTALSIVQNDCPELTPLSTHVGANLLRIAVGCALAALLVVPHVAALPGV